MKWAKNDNGIRPLIPKEKYKELEAYAYLPDKGYIVVDADGSVSKKHVEDTLKKLGLKPFSYDTTDGAHYLFKMPEGKWFEGLGNSIRATILPSKGKEYGVDLKGNYRGYVMLKKRGQKPREDLATIEKEFANAPILPMIFTVTKPMNVHIEDFKAGSRDDTLFKWISKFRTRNYSKKDWCQFVMELCLVTNYDGKNGSTPAEWKHWAEVKWGSSVQMGEPKNLSKGEDGEKDWTKVAFEWGRKVTYKYEKNEEGKRVVALDDDGNKIIESATAWLLKKVHDYYTASMKIVEDAKLQYSADDNQLWGIEQGEFRPIKDLDLFVRRWFIKKFKNVKPSVMAEVGKYLKGATPIKKFLAEQFAVSFLNLTVNARTGKKIELGKDEMNQNVIPHRLISVDALKTTHKDACEFLDKRMNEWTQGNPHLERQLYEMIGVAMTKYMGREKTYFLIGTGSNGKSWFLDMLLKMLGKQNVSLEDLKDLSGNQFSSSNVYGKLANINFDISAEFIDDPSHFKKLSSGDMISAAYKGIDKFTFSPYATNIFGANNIPVAREMGNSDAVNRRIEVLPFLAKFDKDKVTPGEAIDMKEKLNSEPVLEVAILKSIMALQKAIKSRFELSGISKSAFEEHKREVNHMYDFIQKNGISAGAPIMKVFNKYKEWCKPYGYNYYGLIQFTKKYINVAGHFGVNLSKEEVGTKDALNEIFQEIGN